MTDITRRDLLKSGALVPVAPLLVGLLIKDEKYTIVYKATRRNLISFCSPNSCVIQYELNKWIEPKVGKIFAFDTLENVLFFKEQYNHLHGFNDFRIFEARAQDVEPMKLMSVTNYPSLSNNFKSVRNQIIEWWKKNELIQTRDNSHIPPIGTVGVSKIKLIEEIL